MLYKNLINLFFWTNLKRKQNHSQYQIDISTKTHTITKTLHRITQNTLNLEPANGDAHTQDLLPLCPMAAYTSNLQIRIPVSKGLWHVQNFNNMLELLAKRCLPKIFADTAFDQSQYYSIEKCSRCKYDKSIPNINPSVKCCGRDCSRLICFLSTVRLKQHGTHLYKFIV